MCSGFVLSGHSHLCKCDIALKMMCNAVCVKLEFFVVAKTDLNSMNLFLDISF